MYIILMYVFYIPSLPIRESFGYTSFGGPAGYSFCCWGGPGWSLMDKTGGLSCIRRGVSWTAAWTWDA